LYGVDFAVAGPEESGLSESVRWDEVPVAISKEGSYFNFDSARMIAVREIASQCVNRLHSDFQEGSAAKVHRSPAPENGVGVEPTERD
jgi:hypothetical protein